MKKYRSKIAEALHEGFLADFKAGTISEAELREFEADDFIDEDIANEVANSLASEPQEKKPLVTEDVSA